MACRSRQADAVVGGSSSGAAAGEDGLAEEASSPRFGQGLRRHDCAWTEARGAWNEHRAAKGAFIALDVSCRVAIAFGLSSTFQSGGAAELFRSARQESLHQHGIELIEGGFQANPCTLQHPRLA